MCMHHSTIKDTHILDTQDLDMGDNNLTTVSELQGMSQLMGINLWGNDEIYCLELDALEAALSGAMIWRPQFCVQ